MRGIGNVLMSVGALVGTTAGVWLWVGPTTGGLAWLVGIGLIKLTFAAGLGLIASGAVALRIANQRPHNRVEPGIPPQ